MKKIESEIGWEFSAYTLGFIIKRLIDRNNDSEDEEDNEFNRGRHLAYYEMLDIIENELSVRGYSIDDFINLDNEEI